MLFSAVIDAANQARQEVEQAYNQAQKRRREEFVSMVALIDGKDGRRTGRKPVIPSGFVPVARAAKIAGYSGPGYMKHMLNKGVLRGSLVGGRWYVSIKVAEDLRKKRFLELKLNEGEKK